MKALLCSLFLAAGIVLFASADNAQAQVCTWQFCNSIDCQLNFQLFLECPPSPPVAVSSLTAGSPGCWDNPTCTFFVVNQCPPPANCTYSLIINGIPYRDGDIICCTPFGPEDCITCNCAYIRIDPANYTITLEPARTGPGWDCNPPAAVE